MSIKKITFQTNSCTRYLLVFYVAINVAACGGASDNSNANNDASGSSSSSNTANGNASSSSTSNSSASSSSTSSISISSSSTSSSITGGDNCDCGSVDPENPCISDELTIGYEFADEAKRISFEFENTVACGQFTSGRYWAAPLIENGSLQLVNTYPLKSGIGATTVNGLMDNINTMDFGGFPFTGSGRSFNETYALETPHNFDTSAFPKNNRNIGTHTIFKGVSHPQNAIIDQATDPSRKCSNTYRMCEEGIFSLTLLSAPPGDVFAPPFFGDTRPMVDASVFNENLLPNLAPVANMMSFKNAYNTVRFSRIANANKNLNARESHYGEVNVNGSRGYPGYWLQTQWDAVMRTATEPGDNNEAALRLKAAKAISQQAIDLYAIFSEGGNKGSSNELCGAWIANGGFGQGRLGMTIIGLSLIEKSDWLANINTVMSSFLGNQCFGESMMIQPPNPAGRNEPLFGALSSAVYTVSPTNKTAADPQGWRDGSGNAVSTCGSQYQPIVTGGMVGETMAILSFPAAYEHWPANFSHFFDYMDRSFANGDTTSAYAYCTENSSALKNFSLSYVPSSAIDMWQSYYTCGRQKNCAGF